MPIQSSVFTQHQLFAVLVFKAFLETDCRGVVKHLEDCPDLAEAIELTKIPHFTTVHKAAKRLLKTFVAEYDRLVAWLGKKLM